jgi:hypothetical protein
MSTRDREGLIARIRQLRRVAASADSRSATATANPDPVRIGVLEDRVAHLEQLLEGLQDSVYRESERNTRRIAELEARIQPGVLGAALSQDARERGL